MKSSKFTKIHESILIEYINDSDNIISEPYHIFYNGNTRSYVSTLFNNGSDNFLYRITNEDYIYTKYSKSNTNITIKSYSYSQPIKYDIIRVHMPPNYIFDGKKGFYIRCYALDNNDTFIDLCNYYFNISDINHSNQVEFGNTFIYNESQWCKHIDINIPSPKALSNQLKNGLVKDNTINKNLTDYGINENSVIFIDFSFIDGFQISNDNQFFKLDSPLRISQEINSPQDKFELSVTKAVDGDYLIIQPLYNGSIGEFNSFIESNILKNKRYYLNYTITLYERNIKTDELKILITEDFINEIEYRPIVRYSSTTAIIDVMCDLIDFVDGSKTSRFASYTMLPNEVSLYSNRIGKIEMNNANITEVKSIKGIEVSNISNKIIGYNNKLNVISKPYLLYSNVEVNNETYILKPFTNIFKFNLLIDLTQFDNILMIFRDDESQVDIEQYFESSDNDLEYGDIVFKVDKDLYKKLSLYHNNGFNTIYIVGVLNGIKEIIKTYSFDIIDKVVYVDDTNTPIVPNIPTEQDIEQNTQVEPTPINTTIVNNDRIELTNEEKLKIEINSLWKPLWESESFNVMLYAYDSLYKFKEVSTLKNAHKLLLSNGLISSKLELDKAISYFKLYNIDVENSENISYIANNRNDFDKYMESNHTEIKLGGNVPKSYVIYLMRKYVNEFMNRPVIGKPNYSNIIDKIKGKGKG